MKLYYTTGACSLVPRIIINELGLPADFEAVNLATKKTETNQDFLDINPKGSVPALLTDDKEILTENTVILQYLADSNKAENLLPAIGNFKRYRVLEWLNYVTTELHKNFGVFFNPKMPGEIQQSIYVPMISARLTYVDQHLSSHRFLLDDQFTLPDAYLFVMITWGWHFKFDMKAWSNLDRYFNELLARPSIQQSLQQEGLKIPATT